jgi:hypothetical protein
VEGVAPYPVRVTAEEKEGYSRLLPLVKWLFALPHYVALLFLGIGAGLVALVSLFAVLFTGRYPVALWDYMVGVLRWKLRVAAYVLLMDDRYPAFSLSEKEGDRVRIEAVHPDRVERWRPFVAGLLILPYLGIALLLVLLAKACMVVSFFTIVFTGRIQAGVHDIQRNALQWYGRAFSYGYWMCTTYPPFGWED